MIRLFVGKLICRLRRFLLSDPKLFSEVGLFDFGLSTTTLSGGVSINCWIGRDLEQLWTAHLYVPLPEWVMYPGTL